MQDDPARRLLTEQAALDTFAQTGDLDAYAKEDEIAAQVAGAIASDAAPAAAATAAVGGALAASDILKGSDPRASRVIASGAYALPFTDASGAVAFGIRPDGRVNFGKAPTVRGASEVTLRPINDSSWAIPFVAQDGGCAGGIRPDGSAEFVKLKLTPANILQIANETVGYSRSSRLRLATAGDSLTDGYFDGAGGKRADAYPARLQALVPAGVEVFNLGTSGYTVDETAVRIGALPVPLTVEGGSIPASGPVNVTTTAVIGFRPSGTTRNFLGSLAGIPGTLTRTTSDTAFTFTRTTAGSATPAPGAPVFVPDYAGHAADTVVILLGRNNVSYSVKGADASIAEHVAKGTARIVAWLTPQVKQVLVLSVTTTTSETAGSAGYAIVADINARNLAAYPSRYLDLRTYLAHQAIYDLGLVPTPADTAAMNADTLPPSIMDGGSDNTHWSRDTAGLVAAQVNDYLLTRGWL